MEEISFSIDNRSENVDPVHIVIFQKNGPLGNGSLPVALESYTLHRFSKTEFKIDPHLVITASLPDHKELRSIAVKLGQEVWVEGEKGKIKLSLAPVSHNPAGTVGVVNNSQNDDVSIDLCRGLHPLMRREGLIQTYAVVYNVVEDFWIGVTKELLPVGSVLSADVLAEVNTEISYLGISSATIVLTGGGSGPAAQPYEFVLENIHFQ